MSLKVPNTIASSFDCKQGIVRAVRFNVDGNYCITCGSDKTLKLWNPHKDFMLLKTYNGHGYDVLDARGSNDNSHLCSSGKDKCVILWDVSDGKIIRKFRGHLAQVNCVQFNEESTVILSGSVDGSLRIWDCKSKKNEPIQIINEFKDGVTSIDISDHEILAGSVDGYIRRYDLRMGKLNSDYVGKPVTSVLFTKDGQCFLASVLDSILYLFDKHSGELLNEYVGHKNIEYRIDSCLSDKDSHIVSGSEDGKIYIWDLIDNSSMQSLTIPNNTHAISSISFHPTEPSMLSATNSNVHFWKV